MVAPPRCEVLGAYCWLWACDTRWSRSVSDTLLRPQLRSPPVSEREFKFQRARPLTGGNLTWHRNNHVYESSTKEMTLLYSSFERLSVLDCIPVDPNMASDLGVLFRNWTVFHPLGRKQSLYSKWGNISCRQGDSIGRSTGSTREWVSAMTCLASHGDYWFC